METKHCQTAHRHSAKSRITGNTLLVNDSPDRFLVIEGAPIEKLPALVKELKEKIAVAKSAGRVNRQLENSLLAFGSVTDVVGLMWAIDATIESAMEFEGRIAGQKMLAITWLQRLWVEDFLAFPARMPFITKVALFLDPFGLGKHHSWITNLKAASTSPHVSHIPGLAVKFVSTAIGVRELGDLIPEGVCPQIIEDRRQNLSLWVKPLLAMQQAKYDTLATYTVKDWGIARKSRGHDRTYHWVTEKDVSLENWRAMIAEWLCEGRSLALRSYMADRFFAYMIEHPNLPRSVEHYCRRNIRLVPSWSQWAGLQGWAEGSAHHYTNYLADFIDWFLRRYLTADDDHGRPVASPDHYNPITRFTGQAKSSESHRDALPLRYIHELIRIIQADDFAWPKTISTDYFMWHDPINGTFVKTWSPVRAVAILLKLHLPLRTFQVRMLDSGESDVEVFSLDAWVENRSKKSSGKKPVRRGFLRKMLDTSTGRHFTGLYVNTNKTADIYRDPKDSGYEIPWQHEEVIRLVRELLEWQKQFNPIESPMSWASIHDKTVLRSHSAEILRQRGEVCFLFRDPTGAFRSEPVVDSKLQAFWAMLMRELENRVAARGETLPDGSPIRFVKYYSRNEGLLPAALFDLHSLRVSLITAYAIEGGVPIQVLSKCVAGHATVLMTLYYTKPGPAYVSEQLIKAQEKLQRQEQGNFVRFLQDAAIRGSSPLVITNDTSALSALDHNEPSGWVVGDLGICPVGMGRCDVGGPARSNATKTKSYLPVPGGAKNCVRCRFFVTGPAFLGGLVSKFNATGVLLTEASERLRKLEGQICAIEDEEDHQNSKEDLGRLYARRDSILDDVDSIAHNWHATYALIERSKAALRTSTPEKGLNLVLSGSMGDLETALSESTDFDLYNSVCQSATVYPQDGATLANLRRGRLLDAMLSQSGRRPVFASLSEDEALAVGNEFVNLLVARVGHADANALIEGRRMLEAAGVTADIDQFLEGHRLPVFGRHFEASPNSLVAVSLEE
ncbi:VPA1269 family protein [Pseudomonas chlororaphis]|uniref:gamma-mobile-trio integrase GmtZ n=1 Tax=Pseudomonas chlororaphis TaxID=587753 RepID=UPI00236699ED|nr:VPA1269 family protein [Pseudomonas chlororaphis]WDH25655.1 VPA1269 family protein [Pseudomonas chlororaphis]